MRISINDPTAEDLAALLDTFAVPVATLRCEHRQGNQHGAEPDGGHLTVEPEGERTTPAERPTTAKLRKGTNLRWVAWVMSKRSGYWWTCETLANHRDCDLSTHQVSKTLSNLYARGAVNRRDTGNHPIRWAYQLPKDRQAELRQEGL